MWKDKRLSRSIVGSKDSVLGVGLKKLKNYHKYYYSANNSSVVIIGPAFPDSLLKALEEIPANPELNFFSVDLSVKKPDFRIFQERNLHSNIAFSFPTKGYLGLGEERHVFNMAASALNDIYVMRLAKMGIIYEANWNWNIFPESGDFIIFLEGLDHDHVLPALEKGFELISTWPQLAISQKEFDLLKEHKLLELIIGASLTDALPLFTRNFASSEKAHTYEEATDVYKKATLGQTLETVKKVLLSAKPYTVVNLGADSMEKLGRVSQFLEKYYK
jgi:predicted Zn-dependent peptidase